MIETKLVAMHNLEQKETTELTKLSSLLFDCGIANAAHS